MTFFEGICRNPLARGEYYRFVRQHQMSNFMNSPLARLG